MYIITGTTNNDIYNDNSACSISYGDLNLNNFRYLTSFITDIQNPNYPTHTLSLGI